MLQGSEMRAGLIKLYFRGILHQSQHLYKHLRKPILAYFKKIYHLLKWNKITYSIYCHKSSFVKHKNILFNSWLILFLCYLLKESQNDYYLINISLISNICFTAIGSICHIRNLQYKSMSLSRENLNFEKVISV